MSEQIDWAKATWGALGRDIVEQMKGREGDDAFLQSLASKAVAIVKNREPEFDPHDPKKRPQQVALNQINRVIDKEYPRLETQEDNYWYDAKGKQALPKWRHNIFKYMTLGRGIKPIPNQEIETPHAPELPLSQETEQLTKQPILALEDMTIEQLELDADTQQILSTALTQSGMALPDFIRQAIKVYAKTITGKAKKQGEDLSTVSTNALLNDPTYSTHPGRAFELTKRTIKAIKHYNASIATEAADRWCITQSAITALIGSRASTIGKILETFDDEIKTHNQTYNLNAYSNRKQGKDITEAIKLAELVPDGLD